MVAWRKSLVDILPPIQHAHDLRYAIDDTIEDDMREGRERAKVGTYLVSRAPCEGMIFNQRK